MNEAAFLAAIHENPEDDVTRLAYADWLLERGDAAGAARGEFIQVQIELARRTQQIINPVEWIDPDRTSTLQAREARLTELIQAAQPG